MLPRTCVDWFEFSISNADVAFETFELWSISFDVSGNGGSIDSMVDMAHPIVSENAKFVACLVKLCKPCGLVITKAAKSYPIARET